MIRVISYFVSSSFTSTIYTVKYFLTNPLHKQRCSKSIPDSRIKYLVNISWKMQLCVHLYVLNNKESLFFLGARTIITTNVNYVLNECISSREMHT